MAVDAWRINFATTRAGRTLDEQRRECPSKVVRRDAKERAAGNEPVRSRSGAFASAFRYFSASVSCRPLARASESRGSRLATPQKDPRRNRATRACASGMPIVFAAPSSSCSDLDLPRRATTDERWTARQVFITELLLVVSRGSAAAITTARHLRSRTRSGRHDARHQTRGRMLGSSFGPWVLEQAQPVFRRENQGRWGRSSLPQCGYF